MRNTRKNLFSSFVFNAIAVGVLYSVLGLLLNPMIASAAMAKSSVPVVTNALCLRTINV
jgi:Cu+-exporting ATPase